MSTRTRVVLPAILALFVVFIGNAAFAGPTPNTNTDYTGCISSDTCTDNSGGRTGTLGSCHVAANASFIGLACAGSTSHHGKTIKQILGKQPLPHCWFVPMNANDRASLGVHNGDGWVYYWKRCLEGVTKKSKSMAGAYYTVGPRKLPVGAHPPHLTRRQKLLVQGSDRNRQVPAPIAAVSPADHPRVRQPVSFFDSTGHLINVLAGDVALQAHIDHITIHPLGSDQTEVKNCPGTGTRARPGDTPESRPDLCWYAYEHSSADQPDQAYPVEITAHWTVDAQVGGGAWQHFTTFNKSQITTIPVTDVQTLVVS